MSQSRPWRASALTCISWLSIAPLLAEAETAKPPEGAQASSAAHRSRSTVVVTAKPWLFNRQTRYAHSLPEVNGATITVTKKTTVVELADQPSIIDDNQRELTDRLPGIVLAEQQNPSELNLSYRGLGNPQESEYVLLLQDGVPIELDWIGYPTTYYLPEPQTIASVEMIRAGSGLLHGPEPEPVIDFISRAPAPDRALTGTTGQGGGSDGLYSSFNRVSGTSGSWNYLADYARRQSDGERANGGYTLDSGDLHLGYRIDERRRLSVDVHAYARGSGVAGLMSHAEFEADPEQTTTPADHLWTDRYTAVVTFEDAPSERSLFKQLIWTGYQDLVTRSDTYAPGAVTGSGAANFSAALPVPIAASLATQAFDYTGLDGRWRGGWAAGNALTLGYTAYVSHSPYVIRNVAHPFAARDDGSGALFYRDDRKTRYGALFAESLFRLPHRVHVVLSARFDHEELSTRESAAPHPDLVDRTYRKGVPLIGFGIGNDFGRGNETYLNVSQGFRPLRYLDIASPFSNFAASNNPGPTRYLTYEAGVHGWPLTGFYYDASVFQIDAKDRIESQPITQTEIVDVNTGNTRSRGIELESSYDVLRLSPRFSPAEHLDLFLNTELLHARFTASLDPAQVGRTPAYAPDYIVKAGVTWRREGRWKASLVAECVGSQYFEDDDAAVAGTPARIPAYAVADFSADAHLTPHLRLLGGVSNLTDRRYYSRVFLFGGSIEPALERQFHLGAAYDF